MPIYAYRCTACDFEKDYLQKLSDPVLTVCPQCSETSFAKQVTAAGFQLKGSGWYATDFKAKSKAVNGEDKAESPKAESEKSESAKAEVGKSEVPKSESAKAEAPKVEPSKSESSKPESKKSESSASDAKSSAASPPATNTR